MPTRHSSVDSQKWLTGKSYDAIVSQPSHPWTAGASHLFTREFAADVRRRLNEGGVFLQWMNAEFLDEPLLRTQAATLLAEFENVRLYHPSPLVLMFLASDAPLDIEPELARGGSSQWGGRRGAGRLGTRRRRRRSNLVTLLRNDRGATAGPPRK